MPFVSLAAVRPLRRFLAGASLEGVGIVDVCSGAADSGLLDVDSVASTDVGFVVVGSGVDDDSSDAASVMVADGGESVVGAEASAAGETSTAGSGID